EVGFFGLFFFSSRRRHTRFSRDWSSDVCSSDLIPDTVEMVGTIRTFDRDMRNDIVKRMQATASNIAEASGATAEVTVRDDVSIRSEERRVGKEWRSRWWGEREEI